MARSLPAQCPPTTPSLPSFSGRQLRPDGPRPSRPLWATREATAFFDLFAAPPAEFEAQALAAVVNGLAEGAEPRLVKRAARLLQGYEKLYWDTLHALSIT